MLTLIDGNSLLFRAYYGMHNSLTRSDGMPIGAVYSFFNMLLPILSNAKDQDSFVCVFDASRITFRQDIYPLYKANRSETPQDLLLQAELIRIGVHACGIPVICIPNVEADDVIATIATNNCRIDSSTRIITSDKDLMQLVSSCVYLYDSMKQKEIHESEVFEKFGVKPSQVIDVQSLMGDSTDNVPGVPGIGPKKATELISKFGNLDNLYTHIDDVSNERTKQLLIDNKDLAYISKQLVTLKTDVDLSGLTISPFCFNTPEALNFVKTKIESNSLYEKILKIFPLHKFDPEHVQPVQTYNKSECPTNIVIPDNNSTHHIKHFETTIINTEKELKTFLSNVTNILAFDTETTGLNHLKDKLIGISLAYDETHSAYIPIRHITQNLNLFESTNTLLPNQLSISNIFKELMPIFINPNITKIAHNIKYDLHILANEGLDINKINNIDDTMLLSYILHGTLHNHGLDELAIKYLNYNTIKFADLFTEKTTNSDKNFATIDIQTAAKYSCEDSIVCMVLYNIMRAQLNKNDKLKTLYTTCDIPLCHILVTMERNGILINTDKLSQLSNIFHTQLEQLEREIFTFIGHSFNIASPKQLANVLFDELRLPTNKKRSTDVDSLNDLLEKHPIIEKILNWRSIFKLSGTYTDALPKQIAEDGRIHTTYLQTSTNTGRLSSRDPNLQNIPIKTELGEEIRKCFVASDGNVLISIDYSQIQLRLLADIANVAIFKNTFINNQDIHEQTARRIFNILEKDPVPKELRRAAKTVNFSIIYGISPWGLSNQLNISREEAKNIINSYIENIPEINNYITKTKDFVLANACVYTPWGRKIEIPEIHNHRLHNYALRAAINAPIQGFEADIMRKAMVNINNKIIIPNETQIKMLLQVHDEIIFECTEQKAEFFASLIKQEMENITNLSVPLSAEYTISKNWSKQ